MEYLDFRLETVIEHRMRALQQCLVKPLSEKNIANSTQLDQRNHGNNASENFGEMNYEIK